MADKDVKKRAWAFIMYPESMPENWKDILTETGLPIAISPLHDKDLDETGEPKKPHYHVITVYPGPTTFRSAKRIPEMLNATIPVPLEGVRGMYRYHVHLDNPDKFQYSDSDRQFINGFDKDDYFEPTSAEIKKLRFEIQDLIRDNDITEYSILLDTLQDAHMYEHFDFAYNHTIALNNYIRSRRHSQTGRDD